jgi:hypothetical protein
MPTAQQVNDTFNTFMSHVDGHVQKGHPLPNRYLSRLRPFADANSVEDVDRGVRTVRHGARMAAESAREAVGFNMRKVVAPVTGAGTGVGVAAGVAAATGGALSGPAAGIVLGAGLAVGLAALAVQQGIRAWGYHDACRELDGKSADEIALNKDDIAKLFDAVNLGGLSELARSFEKAWEAGKEVMRVAKPISSEVGAGGTCFKAAEHAYSLLYCFKRCIRLFYEGPEGFGDHRLRNVQLFVNLVPRDLFAKAEKALAEYGTMTVFFLSKTTLPPQADVRGPQNEGLLRWKDWADARIDRTDRAKASNQRAWVAAFARSGQAEGDPKGLGAYWESVVNQIPPSKLRLLQDYQREVLARQAPLFGQSGFRPLVTLKDQIKNQFNPRQLPGLALTVARPVTALVVKKCLDDLLLHTALSSGAAWATSGISAGVGGVVSPLVSAFSTMAVEALNSKWNLFQIFIMNPDPARKVRLIRDILEAGGYAEVMHLSGRITAAIDALQAQAGSLTPGMWFEDDLKSMVRELYRLQQYVVRLAVQSVLWELLLALIEEGRVQLKKALGSAYRDFVNWMKLRLNDDRTGNFHKNCKSACYAIDANGKPVIPLFQAW